MNTMPIIKIEIEGLRQSMHHAFSNELIQIDTQFKKALENACCPERIQDILNREANDCLRIVLKREVENYLLHGEGRSIVNKRVVEMLEKEFKPNSQI